MLTCDKILTITTTTNHNVKVDRAAVQFWKNKIVFFNILLFYKSNWENKSYTHLLSTWAMSYGDLLLLSFLLKTKRLILHHEHAIIASCNYENLSAYI